MSSPALARWRYRAGTWLAASPWANRYLIAHRGTSGQALASERSDIVIDGYPRSGNTFALHAFRLANPQARIAHHVHLAAQFRLALRFGCPVLVLLREPEAAVRSLLVRRPELTPQLALRRWLKTYRFVQDSGHSFVIAPFPTLTSNFDLLIDALNARYGCHFQAFKHTTERVDEVFKRIERAHIAAFGEIRRSHLPIPGVDRSALQAAISFDDAAGELKAAKKLYGKLLNQAPG